MIIRDIEHTMSTVFCQERRSVCERKSVAHIAADTVFTQRVFAVLATTGSALMGE